MHSSASKTKGRRTDRSASMTVFQLGLLAVVGCWVALTALAGFVDTPEDRLDLDCSLAEVSAKLGIGTEPVDLPNLLSFSQKLANNSGYLIIVQQTSECHAVSKDKNEE